MKILALLAVGTLAACGSSSDGLQEASPETPLGTGTFAIDGAAQPVAAVWAVFHYNDTGAFDTPNDSLGGFLIDFAASGQGSACKDAYALQAAPAAILEQITITTAQPFEETEHGPSGTPTLAIGTIPVVPPANGGLTQPTTTVAVVSDPEAAESGLVTITGTTETSISGTFTANNVGDSNPTTQTGSFTAPICPGP